MLNVRAPYLTVAEVMQPAFDALEKELRFAYGLRDESESEELMLTYHELYQVFRHALNFYHGGDV